jgi:hypothetical protein
LYTKGEKGQDEERKKKKEEHDSPTLKTSLLNKKKNIAFFCFSWYTDKRIFDCQ